VPEDLVLGELTHGEGYKEEVLLKTSDRKLNVSLSHFLFEPNFSQKFVHHQRLNVFKPSE